MRQKFGRHSSPSFRRSATAWRRCRAPSKLKLRAPAYRERRCCDHRRQQAVKSMAADWQFARNDRLLAVGVGMQRRATLPMNILADGGSIAPAGAAQLGHAALLNSSRFASPTGERYAGGADPFEAGPIDREAPGDGNWIADDGRRA